MMKLLQRAVIVRVLVVWLAAIFFVFGSISDVSAASPIDEIIKKAEQGDADAQYKLAVMYYKGEGVLQNYIYSYAWFKLAAIQGDEDALRNIDEVASLLGPQQLGEAQELSARLEQKIENRSEPSTRNSAETEPKDIKKIKAQADGGAQPELAPNADDNLIWGTPFQFSIWSPVQLFPKDWNVYGLRTNIIYGKNQDIYGLDFGVLANRADNLTGIQIAGAVNRVSESVRGVQIVGFANNVFNADIIGMQIGFGNAAKNLTGIQFGCFAEATDSSTGIQCGAIFSKTDNLKGLQLGFVNITEKGFGVQLGILNMATGMSGLQIGLINMMPNGFLPVFPIINFSIARSEAPPPVEE
jgi:hypothetical protein